MKKTAYNNLTINQNGFNILKGLYVNLKNRELQCKKLVSTNTEVLTFRNFVNK